MKRWRETATICDRIAALQARGERAALATLARLDGSGYRRPGARLLVAESGARAGGLSGGCLEADVALRARRVLEDGRARAARYETGADEIPSWGLRTGCAAALEVWIEPVAPAAPAFPLARLRAALAGDAAFTLAARLADGVVESRVFRRGPSGALAGWRAERFEPPARLVIVGAGADAIPLVDLAATVGFRVTAVDHRPAALDAIRGRAHVEFLRARPGSGVPPVADLAVVKTHALDLDREWIAAFLLGDPPPPYVGVMGSRRRVEEACAGLTPEERQRVRGPVGLDLGGEGPEQIAVSVVAELMAFRAGRTAAPLSRGTGAIHAR